MVETCHLFVLARGKRQSDAFQAAVEVSCHCNTTDGACYLDLIGHEAIALSTSMGSFELASLAKFGDDAGANAIVVVYEMAESTWQKDIDDGLAALKAAHIDYKIKGGNAIAMVGLRDEASTKQDLHHRRRTIASYVAEHAAAISIVDDVAIDALDVKTTLQKLVSLALRCERRELAKLRSTLRDAITHEGTLVKRGAKLKNWKERVFKLNALVLAYYDPKSSGKAPKGVIQRADISSALIGPPENGSQPPSSHDYPFIIVTEKRRYYCSSKSEAERAQWLQVLACQPLTTPSSSDDNSAYTYDVDDDDIDDDQSLFGTRRDTGASSRVSVTSNQSISADSLPVAGAQTPRTARRVVRASVRSDNHGEDACDLSGL
eukprot:TRINITY_DN23918_c0_g1_i1.p1 TRINITY_DN23918_c0_g1~~TRINITY_DN23918_c0_g1_i1.p1  ORF type:complete len:376 (+),score=55.80 TRINITY_DN23918_c0_g1_i1:75-1202(+)